MITKRLTAVVLVALLVVSGCSAMQERRWSYCALGGGLLGAAIGAGTAGGLVNGYEAGGRPGDKRGVETAEAAGSGAVGGALLGTLLGHLLCDPTEEAPPPPPPPPPPAPAPPTGKRVRLSADANFDFNKATLKRAGQERIDADVVRPMKDHPELRALVEGHTDSIGSESYNQKLSERRANAVADYMESQGISASRITTKGWGKSKPIADNSTKEGRAQNRRVEITQE